MTWLLCPTSILADVLCPTTKDHLYEGLEIQIFDRDNPANNDEPEPVYSLLDKVPTDPTPSQNWLLDGPHGQLDTGPKVSCTNLRHILHIILNGSNLQLSSKQLSMVKPYTSYQEWSEVKIRARVLVEESNRFSGTALLTLIIAILFVYIYTCVNNILLNLI